MDKEVFVSKIGITTTWLDGCSGCHMSLLDIDERILDIAGRIELRYSPLVDTKHYPENVDVAIVEGAVSSHEDMEKVKLIRKNSKILVSFGDCAVTANVPGMRNRFNAIDVLKRGYEENADIKITIPDQEIRLIQKARPLHEYVTVDVFLPGCPPPADVIFYTIAELLEGRMPDLSGKTRFGA